MEVPNPLIELSSDFVEVPNQLVGAFNELKEVLNEKLLEVYLSKKVRNQLVAVPSDKK